MTKRQLVIVESPTKAKTIAKFLGDGYTVESSYGHVRDLPKSKLGIDPENNFAPQYVIPRKIQARVTALRKLAAKARSVILATDADREGEAIAWHLAQVLGLDGSPTKKGGERGEPKPTERIVFHEITEHAISEALKEPRDLNMALVDAQQARRILDRLVGYKLSPFLWKKVMRGLSAGRVQSVALRLIADREAEIAAFKPEEYWTFTATLRKEAESFEAHLTKIEGATLDKLAIKTEAEARKIETGLKASSYRVTLGETREVRKNPPAPFTTSTLQQTAAKRLGLSSKKTMYLAQRLYENGYITYMRTDSVNLSRDAVVATAAWLKENLGAQYALEAPRTFKNNSRNAQEAHEAIRPTNVSSAPENLPVEKAEQKLYELIWRRFVACQMPPAIFQATRAEIDATQGGKTYGLTTTGTTLTFDGFLKVWPASFEEKTLPPLKEGDEPALDNIAADQHFTEPPARYNEASLIKTLEAYGIGRPSTYAPIISVIQARNYVEKIQGRFIPTEIGVLVNKVLTENFPEIVDVAFTAKMEDELDEVAEGKLKWQTAIREFYEPFAKHLAGKYEEVSKQDLVPEEITSEICEKCGKPMAVKFGRFGKFLACTGFPDCKNTKTLKEPPKSSGVICAKCLASEDRKDNPGELIERRVRKGRARGKLFWGCAKYPACDFAVWIDPVKTPPVYDPVAEAEKKQEKEESGRLQSTKSYKSAVPKRSEGVKEVAKKKKPAKKKE